MRSSLFVIVTLTLLAGCTACRHYPRDLKAAEALFKEGLELRAVKNTEAAAQSFSNALLALNRCHPDKEEVKRLKAQVEDNLGAMYWKHGLNEEALELHLDAVALSRELRDDTLLMKALRNCGRVTGSLQRIQEAQSYYDDAMLIAESLQDSAFRNELLMETSHDLFMESGDYPQAIACAAQALNGGADPGFCHLVIGLSHYYLENDSLALVHLQEATQSEKPGILMSAYQGLCQLYQYAGDYPQALECHELFSENMMLVNQEFRNGEMERIKADYDLQRQQYNMEAKQKMNRFYWGLLVLSLLIFLVIVLMLLRQKTLGERLKAETLQHQLEQALKKNKVYVTALALTEQITASTLDFDLKENEWDDFVSLIDQLHNGFTDRLLAQYPTLTKGDVQICCLAKKGFSNQVIAILMNQQTASYARRKSRMKQEKMKGLQDERSFEEIIQAL